MLAYQITSMMSSELGGGGEGFGVFVCACVCV